MAKRWLGILILVLWLWSAIFAVCGQWDLSWHTAIAWTVLVAVWLVRGLIRGLRWMFGGPGRVGY